MVSTPPRADRGGDPLRLRRGPELPPVLEPFVERPKKRDRRPRRADARVLAAHARRALAAASLAARARRALPLAADRRRRHGAAVLRSRPVGELERGRAEDRLRRVRRRPRPRRARSAARAERVRLAEGDDRSRSSPGSRRWPTPRAGSGCCGARRTRPLRRTRSSGSSGRTRATLLTALDSPRSTTELAGELGLTPGGVSQHLGVLRDAGLVCGRRVARSVLYLRSSEGDALVGASGADEPTGAALPAA